MNSGDHANVLRLLSLVGLGDAELDLLSLCERLPSVHLDARVVNEEIGKIFPLDEAEALLVVEPLHGTRVTGHLDGTDATRLLSLVGLDDLELDLLVLPQTTLSLPHDVGGVDEHVVTLIHRDEAEALGRVETSHGASSHGISAFLVADAICISLLADGSLLTKFVSKKPSVSLLRNWRSKVDVL